VVEFVIMCLICDKIKGEGDVFFQKKGRKKKEIREEGEGRGHVTGYCLNITDGFSDRN
jgi:hypothetical protein